MLSKQEKSPANNTWIFFDYSGTLVDTVTALSQTWSRFLGKEFPPEKVINFYNDYHRLNKITLMIKYRLNPFKFLLRKDEFEEIRTEEFLKSVKAFPGIPEMLQRLRKSTVAKLGLVSHEIKLLEEEKRKEFFEKFNIPIDFDVVLIDGKNKERAFQEFFEKEQIAYGLFIGDTQFDINLGKKYGLETIGVTWGFSTKEELTADFIIEDPRMLLQLILNRLRLAEQKILHGDPI
ncbi:MAG: HAD hydrolase-like protein [Candidatus Heimdallarchaeota archaeon]|nr:HAD hydrolase-like protein [Candidatus Heimdallarchaeota archaeon]